MKNSSDTIGNQTSDLPPCSAVPQTNCTTACPLQMAIANPKYKTGLKSYDRILVFLCGQAETDEDDDANCRFLQITFSTGVGRDGSVGIATYYGLDVPGIESRWGARFSAPVQTGSEPHPASCTMGTGSFPGVKRPGRVVDHPSLLAPRLKKE